ncbi:MAG: ROK family protein [Myxococcota bacterium]
MKETLSLGIDLGGTKTEAALLRRFESEDASESRFEVLARERIPTAGSAGYDAVLAGTAGLVRRVLDDANLSIADTPVGVGMPGAVTRREGVVKNSNTVCLNGRPFREHLSRELGREVRFENDANCFALAEALLGAARAHRDGVVFGVIMGTGVGGGLVLHGRVWPGPQSLAGEWGHHAVGPWRGLASAPATSVRRDLGLGLPELGPCYCGKTGCLELYASGPAVERDYAARSGERLSLREIVQRRPSDVHAAGAIQQLLHAFGRGLANVIDIVDPSAVVLGGGVSNLDCLYDEGREWVGRYVFNDELTTPILKHELGDSAGVFGAALLWP